MNVRHQLACGRAVTNQVRATFHGRRRAATSRYSSVTVIMPRTIRIEPNRVIIVPGISIESHSLRGRSLRDNANANHTLSYL